MTSEDGSSKTGKGFVIVTGLRITVRSSKSLLSPLLDNENIKVDPSCSVPKGQDDTLASVL